MINRIKRINTEFGKLATLRIVITILGLIGMSIIPIIYWHTSRYLIITIIGLIIGWIFKEKIVDSIDIIPKISSISLWIYGIVLTVGDHAGFDHYTKLLIITITTIITFNLNFWALSDPNICNAEK